MNQIRNALAELAVTLKECCPGQWDEYMKRISNGSDERIILYLRSNELWGGSGSIADQAGVSIGFEKEKRRRIEESLVKLGEVQISEGIINPRTEMWVSAFKKWKNSKK